MGSVQTLVCVKQVKQEVPEEWDETMPLPGDIIEGIAEEEGDEFFMSTKLRYSDLSSHLGKLNKQAEFIWIKIRRGEDTLKLRACIVPDRGIKLQRRYTIRAASDDRHVAVLGDCTLDQCAELQAGEHTVGSTTSRSMAWLSAATSSGAPLVFVNIQTEQVVTSERNNSFGREMSWGRQQSLNTTIQIVQGIRIWFLPGVAEVPIVLTPEPGETRFGMDIKRTEEGFICVYTVAKGSAADRAGLRRLQEQAAETGHLVMISRLDGKNLMPSMVSSNGLIHCCDNVGVKTTLAEAIERMDCINLHIMAWPNCKAPPHTPHDNRDVVFLRPPKESPPMLNARNFYNQEFSNLEFRVLHTPTNQKQPRGTVTNLSGRHNLNPLADRLNRPDYTTTSDLLFTRAPIQCTEYSLQLQS
ncbi:hypothetical protein AQUCO_07600116v1 [Aquilegia coerulea]|uniref:Uncharacterized protein n=1 Tax=Aquilegia coerulea TaxID=218851 RepID=A0A2G5C8X0_AQUCA|nr:hypothetical protein AQUCO_07600116v1 [Aquilegia coerulea]